MVMRVISPCDKKLVKYINMLILFKKNTVELFNVISKHIFIFVFICIYSNDSLLINNINIIIELFICYLICWNILNEFRCLPVTGTKNNNIIVMPVIVPLVVFFSLDTFLSIVFVLHNLVGSSIGTKTKLIL